MKDLNTFSLVAGFVGGFTTFLFGGWDTLLEALVVMTVIDFVTGLLKGTYNNNLSSTLSFFGIAKKLSIYLVIILCVEIDRLLNNSTPLREVAISFYIANEGISIIENVAVFIPLPEYLTKVFEKLKGGKEND